MTLAVGELPAGCILHGVPFGQQCFACATMAGPSFWQYQAPAPSPAGWVCPQCSRSIAPSAVTCPFCPLPGTVTTTVGVAPPFIPGEPIPDAAASGAPRRGRYPVGGPGCPGCNPEESTVLLQLPAHMASGRQHARLDGDWREVLPGLQARLADEGQVQADVEFSLTPQDGQARD
jgi:hypothetical protein